MKKTAILIDSTVTCPPEFLKKNDVHIVPLTINFDNATFKEQGDLNLLMKEVIEKIEREKVMPKTSQPSAQDFLEEYQKIIDKGYLRIYAFHISGKLSGTVQGSKVAAQMIQEENPEIEIEVFDTINAAQVSGIAVVEIAKYLNLGKDLTKDQIQEVLEYYSHESNTLLSVANLDYLALGGRIKPAIAAIGNLFGIKPLLQIKDGEILEFAKVRSNKKAYKKMLELFEKEINENDDDYFYGATHVMEEKTARKIMQSMEKLIGDRGETFPLLPLSPVIGNHTGPGAIGFLYVKKKKFDF